MKLPAVSRRIEMCKIGQNTRCQENGCEWKKVFNQNCSEIVVKTTYVPAEDFSPFFTRRRKKPGRFVKDEKKYVEVKKVIHKPVNFDCSKITVAKQDDWIKKIKTL